MPYDVTMLDAVDALLAPVDPVRGLGWASRELGRLAELDPKLRAARAMVEEHLQGLDQADVTDTLGLEPSDYVATTSVITSATSRTS